MSIKVMSRVWESSAQSGGALLVLLALADFADDEGYCWPAVGTLATKARMGERNARYLLRSLEAAGEISVTPNGGRHGTSGYRVLPGAKIAGGQPVAPGGGKMRQLGGQPVAPKPSGTINEPSIKSSRKAQPATIPELKRREPKPLFDAFRGTFPTAAAALAGQFDSAATAAGLTAADWQTFIATSKAAQDLADGYLTPRTAMTRFQAWAKGKGKSAGSRRTDAEWEAIHLAPSRKGYR